MPKTFGEVLKEMRKEIGVNAKKMAKILGITQSQYSKYENNYLKRVDWSLAEKVLPYIKLDGEIEYTKYKKELIQRIEDINNKTFEINNPELNEYLGNLEIKDINESGYYVLNYSNKQYRINKNGISNIVSLCFILLLFISGILPILQDAITKNFDPKLVQIYALYDALKNDIMML